MQRLQTFLVMVVALVALIAGFTLGTIQSPAHGDYKRGEQFVNMVEEELDKYEGLYGYAVMPNSTNWFMAAVAFSAPGNSREFYKKIAYRRLREIEHEKKLRFLAKEIALKIVQAHA